MPAIVSNKLRLYNARNFVESFDVESLPGPPSTGIYPIVDSKYSNTSVYFFIGRTHSWASNPDAKSGYSDSNPPPVTLSFSNMEFEPWRSMTSAKKITSSDVSLMTNRTNWTSGVVYDFYDDQSEAIVNQTSASSETEEWIPVELALVDRMWLPDTEILRLKGFHSLSVLGRLQVGKFLKKLSCKSLHNII